jgi:hypothetical protein
VRPIPIRVTVFRLMLAVAVLAVALAIALSSYSDAKSRRVEFLLGASDNHARSGAEYRKNAGGDPTMQRLAAWHEFMSRQFEQAVQNPWSPPPANRESPPIGWEPVEADATPR